MTHGELEDRPRRVVLQGISYGVSALLLLRLDARLGEWVSIDDLAAHFGLGLSTVERHCEALHQEHSIDVERIAGGVLLRVRIAASHPKATACE